MSRSTPSSESPPEFFSDRCLGRGAPRLLRQFGWIVHDIADHFPNDAQEVGDPEWMAHGLSEGWSLLTQDKRIRTQREGLDLLKVHGGQIYCLSSGELPVASRADRFQAHRAAIHQHVARGEYGYFVVYDNEVVRRWP